ncbi:hypothetical protein ACFPN1_00195 [Lysobacter yangpyeongensis]|uniref:Uncharacterized protein n=1 Tax=Lysobacter yangpyeongensis TaxID=346182 RepID=A0ABW0SHH3_9GAMM
MNLLSFATMGMVMQGGGGGGGNTPPGSAQIDIVVDTQNGKPKAEPDSAWVSPGGTIKWTCAEPFEIILKLLWSDERVTRKSNRKTGDQHTLEVTAGSVYGKYSYGIAVNGEEVDPDVIIGPRSHNQ